jgi:nucleoside-diphosphate-sugar epimerase
MNMLPVLVTGGAGYVGSHTCEALRAAGFFPRRKEIGPRPQPTRKVRVPQPNGSHF